jgi:adenosylcobyric acid synthase
MMAKSVMIQGTASNAGKSLVAAGLCRIFRQDGYRVAPFKSQNMALNSFITADGLEMGRAQVMQAEAAGIAPDVRMNPILLKPTSDQGSQVIVRGEVFGNFSAKDYYKQKLTLLPIVHETYDSLAADFDIIVIEGAGSPAEINLKDHDLVNMGLARLVDAPVLLVGDIDRGGVFAALAGTLMLLDDEDRMRVKGTIINKFRGDVEILRPGLQQLEEIVQVPVLGVIPYVRIQVDDEDSLSSRLDPQSIPAQVDIAVIRLPRISNFTDFNPFEGIDGVSLRYVGSLAELGSPDLIILPGTKNTMADLLWLRQSGLEAAVLKHAARGLPVFGICGGYQMLGLTLVDPQGVEHGGQMAGLGLLDVHTVFASEKTRTRSTGSLPSVGGLFAELSGLDYEGYEIHMGQTSIDAQPVASQPLINQGQIYGSYMHGLFDRDPVSRAVVSALFRAKGLDPAAVETYDRASFVETQYDLLADTLRQSLDLGSIYRIMGLPGPASQTEVRLD